MGAAYLDQRKVARIADLRLWGWKQVKDGKLVLRVRHFNYLFFFFLFGGRMRRSDLSGCILQWQGYLWYAFWYRIGGESAFWDRTGGEKTRSSNTYPM